MIRGFGPPGISSGPGNAPIPQGSTVIPHGGAAAGYLGLNGTSSLKWGTTQKFVKDLLPGYQRGLNGLPSLLWGSLQRVQKTLNPNVYIGLNGVVANKYGSISKPQVSNNIGPATIQASGVGSFSSTVTMTFFAKTLQPPYQRGLNGVASVKWGQNSKAPVVQTEFTLDAPVSIFSSAFSTLSAAEAITIFVPLGNVSLTGHGTGSITATIGQTVDANQIPLEAVTLLANGQAFLSGSIDLPNIPNIGVLTPTVLGRGQISGGIAVTVSNQIIVGLGNVSLVANGSSHLTTPGLSFFGFDPNFIAQSVWQYMLEGGTAGDLLVAISRKPPFGQGGVANLVSAGGRGLYFEPQTIDKLLDEIRAAYKLSKNQAEQVMERVIERVIERQPIHITNTETKLLQPIVIDADEDEEEAVIQAIMELMDD